MVLWFGSGTLRKQRICNSLSGNCLRASHMILWFESGTLRNEICRPLFGTVLRASRQCERLRDVMMDVLLFATRRVYLCWQHTPFLSSGEDKRKALAFFGIW